MNTKPITTAHDDDLRLSLAAIRRAAQRAQDLALQTGTAIVGTRQRAAQTTSPPEAATAPAAGVQEPPATCRKQP
jgi:hypothetical protein